MLWITVSNQTVGFSKKKYYVLNISISPSYNLLTHTRLNPQLMNNRTLLREKIFLEKEKEEEIMSVKEYQLLKQAHSKISVSYHSRVLFLTVVFNPVCCLAHSFPLGGGPETLASLLYYRGDLTFLSMQWKEKENLKEAHPLIKSYGLEWYTFLPAFH